MNGAARRWIARMLGSPGSAAFERFDGIVAAAARHAPGLRTVTGEDLKRESAEVFAGPSALDDADALARFLAIAREAATRAVGLTAFSEQLSACCALLTGHAVEMETGEGKTLVGAITAAGHVLSGRRVHVLSVNDYLARRDESWMAPFFDLLGITVRSLGQHTAHTERRRAHRADVLYAPVSEVGFDVLRDRFAFSDDERVHPVRDVALIDEADAVLIDEAMVPLVLAGSSTHEIDDFSEPTRLVLELVGERDFTVDESRTTVTLTDAGLDRLEERLGGVNLYDADHAPFLTRLNLALHARVLLHRDVDYLVVDDGIRLINNSRGRVAHLQRWPDGLHAAIEAKEGVTVSAPGTVLDTITIQDLVSSYRSVAGMSGTIVAVADDLIEFYELRSGRVPRRRPNRRVDEPDDVVLTADAKVARVIADVHARHATGQPVLIGTQSVAESEDLAARMEDAGVPVRLLNAKNDAEEAAVIARAGEWAAVTISTQMSGRGTDIRLGGVDERDRDRVVAVGGLAIIATGRYPSSRLDAQLRGRAGRQGDPGTSATVVSLDDELVQTHLPEHVLESIRRSGRDLSQTQRRQIVDTAQRIAEGVRLDRHRDTWAFNRAIAAQRTKVLSYRREVEQGDVALVTLRSRAPRLVDRLEHAGERTVGAAVAAVTLFHLDAHWTEHIGMLQDVRDGIHLRSLAGQHPRDEFHRIALREFDGFFDAVYADVTVHCERLDPAGLDDPLQSIGLRRPSATWTYMITDDPLGQPGDRRAREIGRRWRSLFRKTG
jgi:preprotein translocase subunit SecA